MLKTVAKHVCCIFCLTRIEVDATEIISIHCSFICSVEYACPVWHPGLTKGHHEKH
jgi:hypothetical protein